jgi:predicted ATPase
MRISNVNVVDFRRFANLTITDIPSTAKLVVLAGPNGSGKSSLFDAFLSKQRSSSGQGWHGDSTYVDRTTVPAGDVNNRITISFHRGSQITRSSIYIRTAYRNDPEFSMTTLQRQGPLEGMQVSKLIQTDATVSGNYARLASQAMEDIFINEAEGTTMGAFRDKVLGATRDPFNRIFPHLKLAGIGNPLNNGTFRFDKGDVRNFVYQNLSGGEKAAFDLLLDIAVKRSAYQDSIYCIDEPETHMNTKVQGALLEELLGMIPINSQLWIASHSIGMMRKARELYEVDPGSVVFLDFGGRDFDKPVVITPQTPTKAFWQSVLEVALDDLSSLVAPSQVVICEGSPVGAINGKNVEQDAKIYTTIFAHELPDVNFISAGSASQVSGDFLGLALALPRIASGMKITRLIDLDDHAPEDVAAFNAQGITVLKRRHIEVYMFDDEVLQALCASVGKQTDFAAVLAAKQKAVADSTGRGHPPDDIKSAAGAIYTETKRILGLVQAGNDKNAFMRNTLAPLIKPGMAIYDHLKNDILGP